MKPRVLHIEPLKLSESFSVFILFCLFWGVLEVLLMDRLHSRPSRGRTKKTDEYVARLVSFFHALLSIALATFGILDEWDYFGHFGRGSTGMQQVACLCSAAYFAVDMVGTWLGSYWDALFFWHHVASGGSLLYGALTQQGGLELTCVLFMMEISNPCMHYRWMMIEDQGHMKHTKRFKWLEEVFLYVFFVFRVILSPVIWYAFVLKTPDGMWILRIMGTALLIFSLKFFFHDLLGARRRKELWRF